MNEIKIEVGQVWMNTVYLNTIKLLDSFVSDDEDNFVVRFTNAFGKVRGNSITTKGIREHYTLITNADGSDVKQYRDINVWEAMRLLGEAREPIPVQVRDIGEWYDGVLVGVDVGGDHPFVTVGGEGWKHCRVEVK